MERGDVLNFQLKTAAKGTATKKWIQLSHNPVPNPRVLTVILLCDVSNGVDVFAITLQAFLREFAKDDTFTRENKV